MIIGSPVVVLAGVTVLAVVVLPDTVVTGVVLTVVPAQPRQHAF